MVWGRFLGRGCVFPALLCQMTGLDKGHTLVLVPSLTRSADMLSTQAGIFGFPQRKEYEYQASGVVHVQPARRMCLDRSDAHCRFAGRDAKSGRWLAGRRDEITDEMQAASELGGANGSWLGVVWRVRLGYGRMQTTQLTLPLSRLPPSAMRPAPDATVVYYSPHHRRLLKPSAGLIVVS